MEKEITKYIYFSFENTPPELANTRSLEFSNHKILKYLDHVFIQPLEHTPNHINPKNFEKIRDKYKIKNDDFVLTNISAMTVNKGVEVLIAAYGMLKKKT